MLWVMFGKCVKLVIVALSKLSQFLKQFWRIDNDRQKASSLPYTMSFEDKHHIACFTLFRSMGCSIITDRKGKVMFSLVCVSHSIHNRPHGYSFTVRPCYREAGTHPTGMLYFFLKKILKIKTFRQEPETETGFGIYYSCQLKIISGQIKLRKRVQIRQGS